MTVVAQQELLGSAVTVKEAERLTLRISLKLDASADAWQGALELLREAIESNVYQVLGFKSHGAYVHDRFGGALARMGLEQRREVVRELSDAGLSTRAIAPVFEVSQKTIVKDLQQVIPQVSPEQSEAEFIEQHGLRPDEADALLSSDFIKTAEDWNTAVAGWNDASADDELVTVESVRGALGDEVANAYEKLDWEILKEPVAVTKLKTGIDGKTYRAPVTKKPRRGPITDTARALRNDIIKMMARVEKFMADDRVAANRDALYDILHRPMEELEDKLGDADYKLAGSPRASDAD